jgi:hypothetical protein
LNLRKHIGGKKKKQEEGEMERKVPAALSVDVFMYLSAAHYSFQKNVFSEGFNPLYLQFCPEQQ